MARMRSLEGVVNVEMIIDRDGRVEPDSVKVTQSNEAFDDDALEAVRQ